MFGLFIGELHFDHRVKLGVHAVEPFGELY